MARRGTHSVVETLRRAMFPKVPDRMDDRDLLPGQQQEHRRNEEDDALHVAKPVPQHHVLQNLACLPRDRNAQGKTGDTPEKIPSGKPSRGNALRAKALNRQLHFLPTISGRKPDAADRSHGVQADYVTAAFTLEMSVVVSRSRLIACRVKAPDAVIVRDLMSQIPGCQPFQHAVNRDAVDPHAALHLLRQFKVRERAPGAEQRRQHFNARPGHPCPHGADQRFGSMNMRACH
jgi:hypothetical protein